MGFRCWRRTSKREIDASRGEDIICRVEKRKDAPDSQIVYCLVDNFFEHYRSQTRVQSAGDFQAECINSLTADQCGCNSHVAGDPVKLLAFFIDNFVKSKMFKPFCKFRICKFIISHCESLLY